MRVLLLEDDKDMLETLDDVLTGLGYEVTAVSDSLQAVELTRQQEFDVVITDIRMPGIDGLEALERVREMQPDVRSLVVTGYSTEADSIRAIRLGVGEYLKKPFRLEQFREAVARLAGKIREDEKKAGKESAMCQTLIWALQSVARNLQIAQGGWILQAGGLAYRLSVACELPSRAAELLQLVSLWWSLDQSLPDGLPAFLRCSLPESVQPMVLQLQEGDETQDTMIVKAAQLLAQEQELDDLPMPWREQMKSASQMLSHMGEASPSGPDPGPQRRSILSLALALEDGGDVEGAGLAYADLVAQTASRESAAAALGLARIAKQKGDKAACRDGALNAARIARSLGPLCLAGIGCQIGTLLASAGAAEAVAVLEESSELLGKLGFVGRQAQVRVALGWLQGRAEIDAELAQSLQQSPPGELAESAWWMLPILLNACARQATPQLEQAAKRVLAESPSACSRLLHQGSLLPPARATLARLGPPPDVLQRLTADPEESVRKAANALRQSEAPTPPLLRIFTLGSLAAFLGEERVSENAAKKNQKSVLLLACLAAQEGRPLSEEILAEAFWPSEGAKGRQNLYSVRSILRKNMLCKDWPTEIDFITKVQGGLQLDPALPRWHDYEELRQCLKFAKKMAAAGQIESEMSQLRRAQQLYRGPFLETCYMDWALNIRQQLEHQMVESLLRLGSLAAKAGSPDEAVECCKQALEIDSCCQDAYQLAMQACLQCAQPLEAIRLYERCQKMLQQEFQMEPAIALVELYHRARLAQ